MSDQDEQGGISGSRYYFGSRMRWLRPIRQGAGGESASGCEVLKSEKIGGRNVEAYPRVHRSLCFLHS
jgi:hypothetical protein